MVSQRSQRSHEEPTCVLDELLVPRLLLTDQANEC